MVRVSCPAQRQRKTSCGQPQRASASRLDPFKFGKDAMANNNISTWCADGMDPSELPSLSC
eukprot:909769-Amphidinium_carterae.1